MLKLNQAPDFFRLSGVFLLCVQLFSFVFALYPFQFGTWFNTEPSMVALFSLGALSSLWIYSGIRKNWLVAERPVHPLLYVLAAWVLWQVAMLPFAENHFRSVFGIPNTGEGIAWHILLVILTLFAMPLWADIRHKKIILAIAASSMCVMTYMHFNPVIFCGKLQNYIENNPDTPANWPDYLAFIAVYIWIIFASSQSLHTRRSYLAILTICAATILFSINRMAHYFLPVMFLATGIMLFLRVLCGKPKMISYLVKLDSLPKIIGIIGIFVPLYFVFLSQYPEKFPCKSGSLETRAVFNQIAVAKIRNEPLSLITGRGWGGFADEMFKYGMVDGIYSFKDGEYAPNFMWLTGTAFHSHNQPMEALLSFGVIGFLLFMAIPIAAFFPLRRALFWWCAPSLIGLSAVSVTWFVLPQVLPFQALAYAALCAGRKAAIRKHYNFPRVFSSLAIIMVMFFAVCAWQQVVMINYGERLKYIMSENPDKEGVLEFMAEDLPRGGERLAAAIYYFREVILAKIAGGMATDNDRDWYRNFWLLIHNAAISPDAGLNIIRLNIELSILPFQIIQDSPLDALKPEIKKTLLDSILRISKAAPQREEIAAPYFISLDGVTGGDIEKQIDILKQVLSVAPDHRSALWLLGGIYEQSKDSEMQKKGLEMKQKAILLGVDKVYPVVKSN